MTPNSTYLYLPKHLFFFLLFFGATLWKSNSEKTKHRQMFGRERTAENASSFFDNWKCPNTQHGPTWDRFELLIDSKHDEKRKYRAVFLRFTISACRFRSMARTCVLSSSDILPCPGGRPSGLVWKWRKEASSRIPFYFHCQFLLYFLWSPCLWLLVCSASN